MYRVFVTISADFEGLGHDFIGVSWERQFETYDEAERFWNGLYVKPFGFLATTFHLDYPEAIVIEAEYDLWSGDKPDDRFDKFFCEPIWYASSDAW